MEIDCCTRQNAEIQDCIIDICVIGLQICPSGIHLQETSPFERMAGLSRWGIAQLHRCLLWQNIVKNLEI